MNPFPFYRYCSETIHFKYFNLSKTLDRTTLPTTCHLFWNGPFAVPCKRVPDQQLLISQATCFETYPSYFHKHKAWLLLLLPFNTGLGSHSGVLEAQWNLCMHAWQLWSFPLKCLSKWFNTIYTVWWAGNTADNDRWHWVSVSLPRSSMNASGGGVLVPVLPWKLVPLLEHPWDDGISEPWSRTTTFFKMALTHTRKIT